MDCHVSLHHLSGMFNQGLAALLVHAGKCRSKNIGNVSQNWQKTRCVAAPEKARNVTALGIRAAGSARVTAIAFQGGEENDDGKAC